MAEELHGFYRGGVGFVGSGIASDRCWSLLCDGSGNESKRQEGEQDARTKNAIESWHAAIVLGARKEVNEKFRIRLSLKSIAVIRLRLRQVSARFEPVRDSLRRLHLHLIR